MMFSARDLISENTIEPFELERLLSPFGFKRPLEAHRDLLDIAASGVADAALVSILEPLLLALGSTADPDLALSNLERYFDAFDDRNQLLAKLADDPSLTTRLARVLGGSNFLASVLLRHPEYLETLSPSASAPLLSRANFLDEAVRAVAWSSIRRERLESLHHFQHRELLRIGCTDLGGEGSVIRTTQELSWLADAILQVVLDEARSELADRLSYPGLRFAIIGVGKLGGEELNFSSDIDIIYIYEDESHFDDATKLARRLNHHLTDRTSSGVFYRVDLRLRPEGSRGPMASSMESLETYYTSWGETFERLVLSKARCVAGDRELGAAFLELVEPFVYRKYLDHAAIDEVRDIKRRIDQQVSASGELDRNVKLGWGGIREIEFFIQALQVLYGAERDQVREPSTLRALEKLAEADLIEPDVSERLSKAYQFLRNVEHKLQIVDQRQTHTLPEDTEELERCAGRMGMSLESFRLELDTHRREVHSVFQDLFAEGQKAEQGLATLVHGFVNEAMDPETARSWLESLGFEDARQAYAILESLRDAPAFGHSPARVKNLLANVITPLLACAPMLVRPVKVLTGFERLTASMGAREVFFRSLLENSESMSRLARLFSLSDWLSDTLIQRPGTADFLIDSERLYRPIRQPFETESRRMLEFYLGIQFLFGVIDRKRASRLMSRFAEQQIQRRLDADGPVALFALGKFGERELNYRSDLDVMAFYEGDYTDATRRVEEIVAALSGEFSIDLRLRPEGNKGGLVWNLASTQEYVDNRAEVWERMAWTKARFVAGNAALASRFRPLIETFVYGSEFGAPEIEQMRYLRKRMEGELSREEAGVFNLKLGNGGLVDLEFLAEFTQIRERIRIPNTDLVLRKARVSKDLVEAYHFLRRLESMLRLSTSLSSSRFEAKDIPVLEALMGIPDLQGRYAEVTSRVREAFESFH